MARLSVARLEQRLRNGELVVLDGAVGTELERRGAPMHSDLWCGETLETHPQLIIDVHRSYIEAGADVITTNSYAVPPHTLAHVGMQHKTVPWNRRSAELALAAREQFADGRPVWIAGSVSTFGTWRNLDPREVAPGIARQARILVESGVDLILLETLASQPELVLAAVRDISGLSVPVWIAVSCLQDRESGALLHGVEESQQHSCTQRRFVPFADIVRQATALGGSALLMMHSDLNVAGAAVRAMREHYDGPVGVYPNAGYWERPSWAFVDQIPPHDYARAAQGWIRDGAQIVGGCCGIGPEHIRALRDVALPESA